MDFYETNRGVLRCVGSLISSLEHSDEIGEFRGSEDGERGRHFVRFGTCFWSSSESRATKGNFQRPAPKKDGSSRSFTKIHEFSSRDMPFNVRSRERRFRAASLGGEREV